MRIGLYTPYLDTLTGGEKYMLTIAKCLARQHEVYIFWNDETIAEKIQKRFSLSYDTIHIVPNIFSSKVGFFKRLRESLKYDCFFILSDGSIPLLLSKIILHMQQPFSTIQHISLLTRLKLLRIHATICNSYYTKENIDKLFNINVKVIYPPVHFPDVTEQKRNEILTVGRFNPMPDGSDFKKITFLISAFKKMVDKGLKNWHFTIVTNYFARDEKAFITLKKLINDYPITIHTDVSDKEMEKLYARAKIYWHAAGFGEDLKKYPERAEHFGIATVEALAAGAVPIVLNAGGQREIVKDGENGYIWETEEELIRKTSHVINEKTNFSINQTLLRQTFDEERFCHQIYKIMQ